MKAARTRSILGPLAARMDPGLNLNPGGFPLLKRTAVAAALMALAAPSAAHAATESLTLPLRAAQGLPRVTATTPIAWNTYYVVTAQGTGSFHKSGVWSHPDRIWADPDGRTAVICGTPEPAPMFGTGGKVGFDPETLFARPASAATCSDEPAPQTTRRFQIFDGSSWFHPTPLDGRHSSPRADHFYAYAFKGRGDVLRFRLLDAPASDNYGEFRLTIRPANASDCAGRAWHNFYAAWGAEEFASQADCEATLGGVQAT